MSIQQSLESLALVSRLASARANGYDATVSQQYKSCHCVIGMVGAMWKHHGKTTIYSENTNEKYVCKHAL